MIIIGGGASGLMCAKTAGARGRRTLVLEKSNKLGKKILMSGGGRCNFTNLFADPSCYLSSNPHFCKSALTRYSQWEFIALVEKHGIAYHERKHGELFCDESSKQILAMLEAECRQVGVTTKTGCETHTISSGTGKGGNAARFILSTNHGQFSAESLVIASGGLSIPRMGASGFGYQVAKQFGLEVLPTRAGLVPFTFSGGTKELTNRLSGIAIPVSASTGDGIGEQQFSEDLLFTHRGMSGPVMLQLSNYWQVGEPIFIDLLADIEIESWLREMKQQQPKTLLRNTLSRLLPKSLVLELQLLFWPERAEDHLADYPNSELKAIAENLQRWTLKPSGTEGYRTAEVTLGGVNTDQISSKTMECKTQPGLYFIGEVLDVTGHLGGFNFQWAWASGYAAGEYA